MNTLSFLIRSCLVSAVLLHFNLPAMAQNDAPGVSSTVTVIPAGAVWRYLDDGADAGVAWRALSFNDSFWKAGRAQLGYGDGDEVTVVSAGPDAAAKSITTYFRHVFDLPEADRVTRMILRLLRDDGAVVYLNGQEVARSNMPPGTISFNTVAASVAGSDENQFHQVDLPPSFLVEGRNVLAVEVHQVAVASSDLGFDLELVAVIGLNEVPVVSIAATVLETVEPSPNALVRAGEFTITRTGNSDERLLLWLDFTGSATFGVDYAEVSQPLLMAPGQTSMTVPVAPVDDLAVEGDETVIATLAAGAPVNSLPNYRVDPLRRQATVVIHDNEPPNVLPIVSIRGFETVPELCPANADCPGIEFHLARTGPGLEQPLTVVLRYQGTASEGVDYRQMPHFVTFEAGRDSAGVSSTPIDDLFYEGDETVVAEILPSLGVAGDRVPNYEIDPDRKQATTIIRDNDPPGSPVISLEVVDREATETLAFQNNLDWAEFRVLRTGDATQELVVFLNTQQGSARLGEDYRLDGVNNGSTVRFAPGQGVVNVRLYPIDDDFYEGDETVFFHLIAPPYANLLPDPYAIDHARSSVEMVIHDNDPVTTRLDITSPRNGQHFEAGEVIQLGAQIIGPGSEESWSVEFFDGDQRIGATVPNGTIFWRDAIGGSHVINARATNSAGVTLAARPVTISVGPGPAWPVVSIIASGWRTAEPCPVCLVAPGVFTVSRTGPTSDSLIVYLDYDGTATAGQDYQALPRQVTIPAGTSSAQVLVLPMEDQLLEGPEIVRARIALPELATRGYIASFYASEAMVVIRDDEPGAPEIRLDIVEPNAGDQFAAGTTIKISALGVWTEGEVDRPVKFFAGNTFIGQSDPPQLGRPTIPSLPSVHTIFWTNPPPGHHVLTAHFDHAPNVVVTSPPVHITVGTDPPGPVVRIEATSRIAEEDSSPLDRLPLRGEFTISRSGPTNQSLSVFVHYSGTATPGIDYPRLPLVTIPAGAASTRIEVVPVNDSILEGIETLVAKLSHCPSDLDPPLGIPCFAGFEIDPAHDRATVLIRDDGVSRAHLAITNPRDGASFNVGETILIEAIAIDPEGYISRVEFWDGEQRIGESEIAFIRPPDPGTPIHHSFEWRGAASGNHELTARATASNGTGLRSPSVRITVGAGPPGAVVRIEATSNIAEESSIPFRRLPLRGEFTISRTGPTNQALSAYVHYVGTATPGTDYPHLPFIVTIPAGAASTRIEVVPVDDSIAEGIETLVATLSHCSPLTDPPLGILCFDGFEIDPARARATVFLRDDGTTRASVAITNPKDGANFDLGETIRIRATAIDLDGYIDALEFWDGEQKIGVSGIIHIPEIPPGTPSDHSFEWRNAAAGPHVLTARAPGPGGAIVVSQPVHITVGSLGNQLPTVAITRPANGAEFPLDSAIEIVAETRDPDGHVRKMEFFADDRKIGEATIDFIRAPDPGQVQTFTFTWRQPAPGPHALTARATDDRGATGASAAVEIRIGASEPLPVVTVTAPDPFAVEPAANADLSTASFRIRRHGTIDEPLVVAYSLHGTADNGSDYESLPGLVTIPAGERSVAVIVRPRADNLPERIETVLLWVEQPPAPGPDVRVINAYRVGVPRIAVALISDERLWLPGGTAQCVSLPGDLLHVCFGVEPGRNFRIEASGDLKNWETLFDAVSTEETWHFIDSEMKNYTQRFYRLAPEPVAALDN